MAVNSVNLVGRLGSDPEVRQTASGMAVLSMRVAVSEYRKNRQTGQSEEYTNWVSCSMFGDRAQKVAQYLSKGSKVAISGKLRYSEWERDGQKRSKLEVVVDDIEFMDSRPQQGSRQQAPQNAQQQAYQAPQYAQPAPQAYQAPQPAPQPIRQTIDAVQQQMQQPPMQQQMYDEDIPFGG